MRYSIISLVARAMWLFLICLIMAATTCCSGQSNNNQEEQKTTETESSQGQPSNTEKTQLQESLEQRKRSLKREVQDLISQTEKDLNQLDQVIADKSEKTLKTMRKQVQKVNVFKYQVEEKSQEIDSATTRKALQQIEQEVERLEKNIKSTMPKDALSSESK